MLKELEDKKVVRAYEETKAKGGSMKFMSGPGALGASSILGSRSGAGAETTFERDVHQINLDLDDLWLNIRNFFDDLSP